MSKAWSGGPGEVGEVRRQSSDEGTEEPMERGIYLTAQKYWVDQTQEVLDDSQGAFCLHWQYLP